MAKADRSKAKDARQGRGNKESRSQKFGKKTKKKPFVIYGRSRNLTFPEEWREWYVRGRYATEKQRDEALKTLRKKSTYQEYKKGRIE